MVTGYVAGFNAALEADGASGWCAGEPWVQPITTTDLYANLNDITPVRQCAACSSTPSPLRNHRRRLPHRTTDAERPPTTDDRRLRRTTRRHRPPRSAATGGPSAPTGSTSGGGMLLANPHFPWEGEKRLWESQLTLTTGELNVYGVTLTGVPGVLIGFNDHVAWTHTVSAGHRMTLYELALTPGDPTSYQYGGETRPMTATDIDIEVLQPDGAVTDRVRARCTPATTARCSNCPSAGPPRRRYTIRDANIDNTDILEQFFGDGHRHEHGRVHRRAPHGQRHPVGEHHRHLGRRSRLVRRHRCHTQPVAGGDRRVAGQRRRRRLAAVVLDNGAILLDGSDPVNEWVDDPAATRPGILPFDRAAAARTRPTTCSTPTTRTGWPTRHSCSPASRRSPAPRRCPQSARTRENVILLTDPALRGDDGTFDLAELKAAWFSNRGLHADLLRDQVVKACDEQGVVLVEGVPFDITPACDVLRAWDGRLNTDSRGAVLWREFLASFSGADRSNAGDLYAVPFDPADPVGTPNTLAENTTVREQHRGGDDGGAGVRAGRSTSRSATCSSTAVRSTSASRSPVAPTWRAPSRIVDCCSGSNTFAPQGDRRRVRRRPLRSARSAIRSPTATAS